MILIPMKIKSSLAIWSSARKWCKIQMHIEICEWLEAERTRLMRHSRLQGPSNYVETGMIFDL